MPIGLMAECMIKISNTTQKESFKQINVGIYLVDL